MSRPRIIIADTDVNYIQSLQLKFIEEFFESDKLIIMMNPDGEELVKQVKEMCPYPFNEESL